MKKRLSFFKFRYKIKLTQLVKIMVQYPWERSLYEKHHTRKFLLTAFLACQVLVQTAKADTGSNTDQSLNRQQQQKRLWLPNHPPPENQGGGGRHRLRSDREVKSPVLSPTGNNKETRVAAENWVEKDMPLKQKAAPNDTVPYLRRQVARSRRHKIHEGQCWSGRGDW